MDSNRPRHLDDPSRFGALAAALFSLVGYVACFFLSVIKLRTEHQCRSFIDDVCEARCAATLHDSWSNLWGLPITVYGAALYLTAFVLAFRASSGPPARWVCVPLLAVAWLILTTSAFYAFHATFRLATLCEYCALLYATAIGLFLGAALLNGTRALRPFLVRPSLRVRVTSTLTALGVVTGLALHINLYRRAMAQAPLQSCKAKAAAELPEPFLRVPARDKPEVVIAAFVDFSCPHCRDSVHFWRKYQATRSGALELRFYHFPADCVGPTQHHACEAARVYECLSTKVNGRDFELLSELFALQDGPEPYFSPDNLRAVAEKFWVTDFDACAKQHFLNSEIVDQHLDFAEQHDLKDRPSALLIRMAGERPVEAIPLRGSKKDESFLDRQIQSLRNPSDSSI